MNKHYYDVVYLPSRDFKGMRLPSQDFHEDDLEGATRFFEQLDVPYKALWEVYKSDYAEYSTKLRTQGSFE